VIAGETEFYRNFSNLEEYLEGKGEVIARILEPAWRAQSKRLQEINKG